jgi:hypothetical protein
VHRIKQLNQLVNSTLDWMENVNGILLRISVEQETVKLIVKLVILLMSYVKPIFKVIVYQQG